MEAERPGLLKIMGIRLKAEEHEVKVVEEIIEDVIEELIEVVE